MKSIVILVTNDGLGRADPALRHKMMSIFLKLLDSSGVLPSQICFYTEGVKLVVQGSPILAELRAVEAKKVELIVCRTCLEYFGLEDRVAVGIVGGMTDIVEAMWKADSVITV
jgi:intracellular sulfur oxidation DsrE/DsrF family protein